MIEPKIIACTESCASCSQPIVSETKAFWAKRNRELIESAREIAKEQVASSDNSFDSDRFGAWFDIWILDCNTDIQIKLKRMRELKLGLFPWIQRKKMLIELRSMLEND